jgi:hypothetical protein
VEELAGDNDLVADPGGAGARSRGGFATAQDGCSGQQKDQEAE